MSKRSVTGFALATVAFAVLPVGQALAQNAQAPPAAAPRAAAQNQGQAAVQPLIVPATNGNSTAMMRARQWRHRRHQRMAYPTYGANAMNQHGFMLPGMATGGTTATNRARFLNPTIAAGAATAAAPATTAQGNNHGVNGAAHHHKAASGTQHHATAHRGRT
jgi:hypothetical protein